MFDDLLRCTYKLDAEGPDEYDCFTLSREVLRRVGIHIPRWPSFADSVLREQAVEENRQYFTCLQCPEAYCIVVFIIRRKVHIGVVLEDATKFIHINEKVTAIERIANWRKRIEGFYRFNNTQKSV